LGLNVPMPMVRCDNSAMDLGLEATHLSAIAERVIGCD